MIILSDLQDTDHRILSDNTCCVFRWQQYHSRKIRAAVEIAKYPNNMNRDDEYPYLQSGR